MKSDRLERMMNWLAENADIAVTPDDGKTYDVAVKWPGMPAGESFYTQSYTERGGTHIAKLIVQGAMWATRLAYEATEDNDAIL